MFTQATAKKIEAAPVDLYCCVACENWTQAHDGTFVGNDRLWFICSGHDTPKQKRQREQDQLIPF